MFDWPIASDALDGFGGELILLRVPKSGLPFFDALQLYGAIDLYIGLREDVRIHDAGNEWQVEGRCRKERLEGRDERILRQVRKGNLKPKLKRGLNDKEYCQALRSSLCCDHGSQGFEDTLHQANGPFSGFDSAMQSGIRGVAAAFYETMQSGQSTAADCIAKVPLSQALLALAGKRRTEAVGDILFLPVFEGPIDLSKVVSPVRAWLATPNAICAQALMLLALKTSLFAEGYQDRLRSVIYNKQVKKGDFAYSGQIEISATAVGRMNSPSFASHVHRVFRALVHRAWTGKEAELVPDALAMTHWLMQPVAKNLSGMITSQEKLKAKGYQQMFTKSEFVKEVSAMTYGECRDDAGNIHMFARAVARAIYYARMESSDDPAKRWYDEVATLRSAPNDKAFFNRALNLIELGHRENTFVGTEEAERFDACELLKSAGNDFETFRDIFRMYLIQESRPRRGVAVAGPSPEPTAEENRGDSLNPETSEEAEQ